MCANMRVSPSMWVSCDFFCSFLFVVVVVFLFYLILYFYFLDACLFSIERKKGCGWRWEGRCGRIWEEVGEEKL